MADFTQDISKFTRFGIYNYRFDEVGNEILNPSSSIFQENFFAFNLTNVNYDQTKILSFYDPTFTEFVVPVSASATASVSIDDVQTQLANAQSENTILQAQLNELVALNTAASGASTQQSIKDLILSLRVQLGQGIVEGDFDTTFPYAPLPPELQASNQTPSS